MKARPVEPTYLVVGAALVAVLWLPFGFSLGGLIEEWGVLFRFERYGIFFVSDSSSPMPAHAPRPLTVLPHAVAHWLAPDSFIWWHLLAIGALVTKFYCAAKLGQRATGSLAAGALIGALAVVAPGDTMQMNFRSLHINLAIAVGLSSAVCATAALDTSDRRVRVAAGLAASALLVSGVMMYEVALAFFFAPFAVIFARSGAVESLAIVRRRLAFVVSYASACAGCLVWIAWAATIEGSYQKAIVSVDLTLTQRLDTAVSALFEKAFFRLLFDGWREAFEIAFELTARPGFLVAAAVGTVAAMSWFVRRDALRGWKPVFGWAMPIRLLAAGAALLVLGYAPYAATPSHLTISQRVFLASVVGSALMFAALVLLLARATSRAWVVVALGAPLVVLGVAYQVFQQDRYNTIYAQASKPMIAAMRAAAAVTPPEQEIAILNRYGYLNGTWDMGMMAELAIVVIDPRRAAGVTICEAESGEISPFQRDGRGSRGTCAVEAGVLVVDPAQGPRRRYDTFLDIDVDGRLRLGGRELGDLATLAAAEAPGAWSPDESLFDVLPGADDGCAIDSMWGYSVPCRTFGVFEGETAGDGGSVAWARSPTSGFYLAELEPGKDYVLRIELYTYLTPAIEDLAIAFNGVPLDFVWLDPRLIEAPVAGDLVSSGTDVLSFTVPLHPQDGLSLGFRSVSAVPAEVVGGG